MHPFLTVELQGWILCNSEIDYLFEFWFYRFIYVVPWRGKSHACASACRWWHRNRTNSIYFEAENLTPCQGHDFFASWVLKIHTLAALYYCTLNPSKPGKNKPRLHVLGPMLNRIFTTVFRSRMRKSSFSGDFWYRRGGFFEQLSTVKEGLPKDGIVIVMSDLDVWSENVVLEIIMGIMRGSRFFCSFQDQLGFNSVQYIYS